jgi:hypothetical protein
LLTFTALFKDSTGNVIGRFRGGKSLHGGEIGNSALWKSHEEMQLEMIGESVRQIARFIETNGALN